MDAGEVPGFGQQRDDEADEEHVEELGDVQNDDEADEALVLSAQRTRVDLFEGAWPLLMNRHYLLSSVVRLILGCAVGPWSAWLSQPFGSFSRVSSAFRLGFPLRLASFSAAPRFVDCLFFLVALPLLDCPPLLHEVEAPPRLFDGELAGGRGGGDRSESGC